MGIVVLIMELWLCSYVVVVVVMDDLWGDIRESNRYVGVCV